MMKYPNNNNKSLTGIIWNLYIKRLSTILQRLFSAYRAGLFRFYLVIASSAWVKDGDF